MNLKGTWVVSIIFFEIFLMNTKFIQALDHLSQLKSSLQINFGGRKTTHICNIHIQTHINIQTNRETRYLLIFVGKTFNICICS